MPARAGWGVGAGGVVVDVVVVSVIRSGSYHRTPALLEGFSAEPYNPPLAREGHRRFGARQAHEIHMSDKTEHPPIPEAFEALGVRPSILRALAELKFVTPSEI